MLAKSLTLAAALVAVLPADAAGPLIVNTAPGGADHTRAFWTAERMAAAQPDLPILPAAKAAGTATLDFTRSRLAMASLNRVAPYRSVGKLFYATSQGTFQCTAAVIAKRLVVTAAHCITSAANGVGFNFLFVPAYDGSQAAAAAQRPFGTWSFFAAYPAPSWYNSSRTPPHPADFAIIELEDQSFDGGPPVSIGTRVGTLAHAAGHLFDTHVTILGYGSNLDSGKILQRNDSGDHRPGTGAPDNNVWEYGADLGNGSGGAPWIENFGNPYGPAPAGTFSGRNAVVGVTSYGFPQGTIKALAASGFNAEFTEIFNYMCAYQSGNC